MGLQNIWSVIYLVSLIEVGFEFRYLTAFFFFLTHLNSLASSMSVQDCKRITKGRKKREQDSY